MSSHSRTSKECTVDQLHPQLYGSIQEYFQTHKMGILEEEIHLCCETTSEKRASGKLASLLDGSLDVTSHLALLLTDEWLIWAHLGDQSGVAIFAARLKGMRLETFQTNRSKELRLEISAFVPDTKEFVRGTLQLGTGPAAQKFCKTASEAVSKLNPPTKRRFLGLTSD